MKLIQSGTFNKQQTRRPSDLIQTLYFLVRALISEKLSASGQTASAALEMRLWFALRERLDSHCRLYPLVSRD